MTYGKIINDEKYICLHNDNNFKKLSLEDNVYFTLRDIFLNIEIIDYCFIANDFNIMLTNNICFEDRHNYDFKYANVLHDCNSNFTDKLVNFLSCIKEYQFEFEKIDVSTNEQMDMHRYIKFDIWWNQFNELQNLLKQHQQQQKLKQSFSEDNAKTTDNNR
jgi:hypothetical protein